MISVNQLLKGHFYKGSKLVEVGCGKGAFLDIVKSINRILRHKDFRKNAKRKPKSIKDIKMADNWSRLKTVNMCVR